MDKNAIKKYAVWARRELISRVSQKAAFYGITNTDHGTVGAESVDGRVLTAAEKKQRDALIHQIQKDGYEQTIEEVAYTWFNRFSALRYMEVNGYLPTHVRVFTDDTGALKPQILTEAINLELDGDVIKSVEFIGGCDGNLQGISKLVTGMKAEDAIKRLEGIQCGFKPTSCPDQLAKALRQALAQ